MATRRWDGLQEEGERVTGLKGWRVSVCIEAAELFATLLLSFSGKRQHMLESLSLIVECFF